MRRTLPVFLWVLILSVVCGRAPAVNQNLERVGQLGGRCRSVAVTGHYALLGEGAALDVLDIQTPSRPVLAGRIILPDTIYDIATSGTFAYLALGDYGMQVIDLADPARPRLRGSFQTDYAFYRIKAAGSRVYALSNLQLFFLDVSDPDHPTRLGKYVREFDYWDWINDFAVSGNWVYVCREYTDYLEIVDISQPADPIRLSQGFVAAGHSVIWLKVSGNTLYILSNDTFNHVGILEMFSVADPQKPARLGGYQFEKECLRVAVQGGAAYVITQAEDCLYVVDITKPQAPTLTGTLNVKNAMAWDVAAYGPYTLIADETELYGGMLRVVDARAPARPVQAGSWRNSGWVRAHQRAGGLIYVLESNRLAIYNGADPALPKMVGSCPLTLVCNPFVVARGAAYAMDGEGRLLVADVSDPTSPTQRRVIWPAVVAKGNYDLAESGRRLYVAAGKAGMKIYDLNLPTSPTLLGTYAMAGEATAVAVKDNLAYVGENKNYDYSLNMIDVRDPRRPALVNKIRFGSLLRIRISGNLGIFISENYSGLYDITNPTSPVLLTYYDQDLNSAWVGMDAFFSGDRLYMSGPSVMDISNPKAPVRLASAGHDTAATIDVAEDLICQAGFQGGLEILRTMTPPARRIEPAVKNMELLSSTRGTFDSFTVRGSLLYAAGEEGDGGGYLDIYDISDPRHPALRGSCFLHEAPRENAYEYTGPIALKGNYALNPVNHTSGFASHWDEWSNLMIVDIADPAHPKLVKEIEDFNGYIRSFRISGNTALAVNTDAGYYYDAATSFYDVTNPLAPVFKYNIDYIDAGHAFLGNLVYTSWDFPAYGFGALDISDPENLVIEGVIDRQYDDAAVDGDRAYAIAPRDSEVFGGRLDVLNMQGHRVTVEGTLPFSFHNPRIAASNGLVAICDSDWWDDDASQVRVVDVVDPAHPAEAGWYKLPGWGVDQIQFVGDTICAASGGELKFFRFKPATVGVTGVSRPGYGVDVLRAEKAVYADRSYVFQAPVGADYNWRTYILTRNEDKDKTGSSFLSFNVDQPTTVYVGLDARIAEPPGWLAGWMRTADELAATDPGEPRRVLYKKSFAAGKVTLGANRDSGMPTGNSMYSVVLVPVSASGAAEWMGYE